jgi:hypothetical protein
MMAMALATQKSTPMLIPPPRNKTKIKTRKSSICIANFTF